VSLPVALLRDLLARVTRTHEALLDGDHGFAEQILADLAADLWRIIETAERKAAA
jgi:hypothetical protein